MHANLVMFKNDGTQKVFPLSRNTTVIGRRHDCDLRIPLEQVSRRHCRLSMNNDSIRIHDLGSSNGTFCNGKRVDETIVKAGDYITIGPLTFLLQIDGKPEKVVPPQQVEQKPSQKTSTKKEKPLAKSASKGESSDSFAALDLSDSFISELEEL